MDDKWESKTGCEKHEIEFVEAAGQYKCKNCGKVFVTAEPIPVYPYPQLPFPVYPMHPIWIVPEYYRPYFPDYYPKIWCQGTYTGTEIK